MSFGSIVASLAGDAAGMLFNRKEAEKGRNFSEYMSNTSHRREVEDLKAAGLNPLLSATQGASTPGASVASHTGIDIAKAIQTSTQQELGDKSIQQMGANIGLTNAQKKKTEMETKVIQKDLPKSDIINRGYKIIEPAVKFIEKATQPSTNRRLP